MEHTIAAVSTPIGSGGIAVIRISGTEALKIADKVFFGKGRLSDAPTHTVHYGFIKDADGNTVDEVLATVMRAPRTFTREDVVEISTHGGISASQDVLDTVIRAGASIAEPGEFTKRAFLNGRIDLSQAEAVIDIINSKSALAKTNALHQLEGNLSSEIKKIRSSLVQLSAQMQVIIDYPDEDLEDVTAKDIERICSENLELTRKLLKTADNGRIMREGIRVSISGKPNVGKSSVLNMLSHSERAIVTDIAGTTRDVIEEFVNLDGIPLILSDTAGIRNTDDTVEKIGVERSLKSIDEAELVLAVLDGSRSADDDDKAILGSTKDKKRIILVNKSDIAKADINYIKSISDGSPVIEISALTGSGADELAKAIKDIYKLGDLSTSDGTIITNMRHKKALGKTEAALARAVSAIRVGMPADIAAIDINAAIEALGEITGETVSELIVDSIFHNFCVGK